MSSKAAVDNKENSKPPPAAKVVENKINKETEK